MSHRWAACRGLMLASLLCLVGSPLYAEEAPATKGAKSVPRRYVLRYRANYTCTYPVGASDVVKASGSIAFQVPPGGGAVAATGSFRHVGTGYVFAGPLILKGQGSGGFLEFTFPAGFSGGQRVYNRTDALRLELKDGATVNVPFKPIPGVAAHCAGECRLTIEKPVDAGVSPWTTTGSSMRSTRGPRARGSTRSGPVAPASHSSSDASWK